MKTALSNFKQYWCINRNTCYAKHITSLSFHINQEYKYARENINFITGILLLACIHLFQVYCMLECELWKLSTE